MKNKDLERAIYMWFNMKYEFYSRLDHDDSIYLYDDGEEYAEVRIDKKSEYVYYKWDFYKEFSGIIPLIRFEFERFMIKWVGDTFGLKGFTTWAPLISTIPSLKIPK